MARHLLVWRGWHYVSVEAETKEEAIKSAIATKPHYIPPGVELHYGRVGSSASAAYVTSDESDMPDMDDPL